MTEVRRDEGADPGPGGRRIHDWGETRRATWLELFFDLVFVVAVARLAVLLHDDHTVGGLVAYAGLFVPIWWAWISFSYYADLFDDDGVLDRVAQLAAMLGIAVVAVSLTGGVGGDNRVFAGVFAAMFLVLGLLYLSAGRQEPRAAELCRWYTAGSWSGAALWAVSLAVPTPARYWVWGAAVIVNAVISGPLAYARIRQAPEQVSHMPERFGLFTIVVLGESILGVVNGLADAAGDAAASATAVAGFVIAAGVWWVYFEGFDESAIDRAISAGRGSQVRSFLYGYGHLLVYAAIAAAGVAVEVAVEEAAHGGHVPWLLAVAITAIVVGFVVISSGIGLTATRAVLAGKVALVAVSIAVVAAGASALVGTAAIAVAWVALVVLEWRHRAPAGHA